MLGKGRRTVAVAGRSPEGRRKVAERSPNGRRKVNKRSPKATGSRRKVAERSPKGRRTVAESRRSCFNSCPFRFTNLDQAHTSPCRCVPRANVRNLPNNGRPPIAPSRWTAPIALSRWEGPIAPSRWRRQADIETANENTGPRDHVGDRSTTSGRHQRAHHQRSRHPSLNLISWQLIKLNEVRRAGGRAGGRAGRSTKGRQKVAIRCIRNVKTLGYDL